MPPIGLFSALADETRCTILAMLHQSPMPVHKLAEAFDISRPAISRHLRVLGEVGLVRERKKGRENIYELKPAAMTVGRDWIADFLPKAVEAKPEPIEVAPAIVVETPPEKTKKVKAEKPKPPKPAPAVSEQFQMTFDL